MKFKCELFNIFLNESIFHKRGLFFEKEKKCGDSIVFIRSERYKITIGYLIALITFSPMKFKNISVFFNQTKRLKVKRKETDIIEIRNIQQYAGINF